VRRPRRWTFIRKPPIGTKWETPEARRLWAVVDGAVKKALDAHPEYLSTSGVDSKTVRNSITKRVVADILSCRKAGPTQG
jgi:hypothetical protein